MYVLYSNIILEFLVFKPFLSIQGKKKGYGAGVLSSFGEMEFSCATYRPAGGEENFPVYRKWDPKEACKQEFPITTYQPVYFVAEVCNPMCLLSDICAN